VVLCDKQIGLNIRSFKKKTMRNVQERLKELQGVPRVVVIGNNLSVLNECRSAREGHSLLRFFEKDAALDLLEEFKNGQEYVSQSQFCPGIDRNVEKKYRESVWAYAIRKGIYQPVGYHVYPEELDTRDDIFRAEVRALVNDRNGVIHVYAMPARDMMDRSWHRAVIKAQLDAFRSVRWIR